MAIRNTHISESGIWFITFTCYKWMPLFSVTNGYDIVYKWFDYLKSAGHDVCGYVIMPNHIHMLLVYRNNNQSLNTIVGNGKRFMAYEIIGRLKEQNKDDILDILNSAVTDIEAEKQQKHRVFEPSFEAKKCDGYKFLHQKLDYIHANPVSGKWQLAFEAGDYAHSSAYFYETGEHRHYPVTGYMNLDETKDWY